MKNDLNKEMPDETLGAFLQSARTHAGLSLRDVAAETGISKSMIGKLELDEVGEPRPSTLEVLAASLGVSLVDMYAAAGYKPAKGLPTFAPYLRSKYRKLPPDARAELQESFDRVANKYGYASQGPAPGQDETEDEGTATPIS